MTDVVLLEQILTNFANMVTEELHAIRDELESLSRESEIRSDDVCKAIKSGCYEIAGKLGVDSYRYQEIEELVNIAKSVEAIQERLRSLDGSLGDIADAITSKGTKQ